jgi:hypothetical protein
MSKPKCRWWGYVREVVRAYPALKGRELNKPDDIKDREAVANAIAETMRERDGSEHVALIRYVYWEKKQHRVKDAAPRLHISEATAKRWHGEFIRAVAKNRGFDVE